MTAWSAACACGLSIRLPHQQPVVACPARAAKVLAARVKCCTVSMRCSTQSMHVFNAWTAYRMRSMMRGTKVQVSMNMWSPGCEGMGVHA
jgi:hypothetical protein